MVHRIGLRAFSSLYRQVVVRATEGIDPSHLHGPTYYPRLLAADFGPWLLAGLPALALAVWWLARRRPEGGGLDARALLFVAVWALGWVALFSLSSSKLSWYVYPAYSGLSLLLARGLDEVVRRLAGWVRGRWVPLATAALALAVGAGLAARVETLAKRVDRELPVELPAHRLATLIEGLPRARVVRLPKAGLTPWDLYYLGPLMEKQRRLPEELLRPTTGLCRFLVAPAAQAPRKVEVADPGPQRVPLGFPDRGDAWLLDLDRCLPPWA